MSWLPKVKLAQTLGRVGGDVFLGGDVGACLLILASWYQWSSSLPHHCWCCLLLTCWLQGYAPRWTLNDTVLTCTPKSSSLPASAIISIAASAAGALLLAAVGLLVWLRLTVQLRPKWQREKQLLANRKKGVPCGAAASVVVTDVEQYSAMMQVNPQLTTKALGGCDGCDCP